jgi:hypothetical protein
MIPQIQLETSVNNRINLYVSKALLNAEAFEAFWEEVKESGYLTKSEAKGLWSDYVWDQAQRYGELCEVD